MAEDVDIVIAGVGLITPLGRDTAETFDALLAGRFMTEHGRAIERGEEPNVIELADTAAREAIAAAGWEGELHDDATALIVGTSKGPADEWLVDWPGTTGLRPVPEARGTGRLYPPTSDKPLCEDATAVLAEPAYLRMSGLHEIAQVLSHRLTIGQGPKLTVSAACASGLHALIRAAILLRSGDADRVLVVGSESSLHDAFIQSFKRLGVIAADGEPCRPFDVGRSGFLISESAAAVCLERRPARGGDIAIDGYAIGADASHLTSTDANALTLKNCLKTVLNARPVDLVHAHATGTIANDPIELAAIESVAGERETVYSHKGAIGHTLGASGMVAAALNVLMHRHGVVPGNVCTRRPLASRLQIGPEPIRREIRRSIAIAAGFGGATGVVGLRTVDS